jgi:hypothetical protein
MQLKRVEITELKGINENAVEGVAQQQPASLVGLDFDRAGGYRAFRGGRLFAVSGSTLATTFINSDETGLASWYETGTSTSFPGGEVTLRIYDGDATVEEDIYGFTSTFMTTSSTHFYPVHYPNVGVNVYPGGYTVSGRVDSVFFVKQNDDTFIGASDVYAGSYSTTQPATTGSGSIRNRLIFYGGFSTDAGVFLAPLAEDNSSSQTTGDTVSASFTYSSAPSEWTVYAFGYGSDTGTSIFNLQAADTSGTWSASVTEGSAVITGSPFLVSYQNPVALYRQRVYGRMLYPGGTPTNLRNFWPLGPEAVDNIRAPILNSILNTLPVKKTLWYTNIGYANLSTVNNYFVVPFSASEKITGLAETPAGLLIFGDNETFLMRGDPASSDFQVQLVSGVIGCDDGVNPVRLGGTVFVVSQGEIYAMSLGMGDVDFGSGITKISEPVFDPSNVFDALASEPKYRQIVAKRANGELLRFDAETQQWFTDVISTGFGITSIFSNPDTVKYSSGATSTLYDAYGTQVLPRVTYENVDLGDKGLQKMWRRIRIYMNDDYSGSPRLDYTIAGSTSNVTATEEAGKEFVFTLPSGLVSHKIDSAEINLVGAVEGDTLEPPVIVEFIERYRRR